jgi:hypothetical protein
MRAGIANDIEHNRLDHLDRNQTASLDRNQTSTSCSLKTNHQ